MIPRKRLKKILQTDLRTNRLVTKLARRAGVRIPTGFRLLDQGSSCVATLGWLTQSLWDWKDCRRVIPVQGLIPLPFDFRLGNDVERHFRAGSRFLIFAETSSTGVPHPGCLSASSARSSSSATCSGCRSSRFQPKRLRASSWTCSQRIPACGFLRSSSARRSSSAICSCVGSGSYPFSTMLLQTCCASSRRSARLNLASTLVFKVFQGNSPFGIGGAFQSWKPSINSSQRRCANSTRSSNERRFAADKDFATDMDSIYASKVPRQAVFSARANRCNPVGVGDIWWPLTQGSSCLPPALRFGAASAILGGMTQSFQDWPNEDARTRYSGSRITHHASRQP